MYALQLCFFSIIICGAVAVSVPLHGNWCGPGHGSGNPIDKIDKACKVHDECYDNRGYFDCKCDQELVLALPAAIRDTSCAKARAKGTLILAWFAAAGCTCKRRAPCGYSCKTCNSHGIPHPCCSADYCDVRVPVSTNAMCL